MRSSTTKPHRSSLIAAIGVAAALTSRERPAAAETWTTPPEPSEVVVEKRSRLLAAIPFGAGQFQNGDIGLGVFFLSSEVLTAATSIASAVAVSHYAGQNPSTRSPSGAVVNVSALNQHIVQATVVNRIAFVVWATLIASGLAEAQIDFVPERVTRRKRPKPPLAPLLSADGRGGEVGVVGRF